MKLSILFFFASLFTIQANPGYSQEAKISLDLANVSVERLLEEIESQSEFRIVYRIRDVELKRVVSLRVEKEDINTILDRIFDGTRTTYEIIDQQVFLIKRKKMRPSLRPVELLSRQDRDREQRVVVQDTLSGMVTDASGEPLIGVNVQVKGTTIGTASDFDGRFELIDVDDDAVLVFSYVGYQKQEVAVMGRSDLDVTMVTDAQMLDEVVVTALGIKREAKTLGYATATVDKLQLTENRTGTALGTLQGKVSGVNITSLGTGPAGSTRIRIRGNSAFSGANLPLLVVNGVPMDNTRFSEGSTDLGDGMNSINPDDVESMTVLKGAAAAALYGSRAKDGVIMITTKSGNDTKGFGVTYNANYTMGKAIDYTDFQTEYGQGEGGIRPTSAFPSSGVWSWGEKIEPGMTQVLFDNEIVPYELHTTQDRFDEFLRPEQNLTNSLSFANSGDNGGFNVSFSNTDNKGLMPNSEFKRRNIDLGFSQNISKYVTVTGNVNYSNENYQNAPTVGNQIGEINALYTMSNTMPLSIMKKYTEDPVTGDEYLWSRFTPRVNPYFALKYRFNNNVRDRLIGNVAVRLNLTDDIYFQARIAQDFYSRLQDYNQPTGLTMGSKQPAGYVNGQYDRTSNRFSERNYDFLLGIDKTYDDIGVNVTLGGNQMSRSMETENESADDFVQRGLYTIMNGRIKGASHSLSERAVNSLYGAAEVSYKSILFLNGTLRNDWFSTLSPDNRSILYPSLTSSFIFSDAIDAMPDWLSFGKFRLSYAEVGDDNVSPYSNVNYYSVSSNLFSGPSGSVPVGNIASGTIANPNLRPLRVAEWETGVDVRLFNNAIGFDFAVYRKLTSDQIVSATISQTTGYNTQLINIGESISKGVESSIQVSPVATNYFTWSINANVAYNTSEVTKLGESDADTTITIGSVRQVVGQPLGQLYWYVQAKDANGNKIFNKNSGYPVRSSELVNVGRSLPTWFGGITNSFNYKGVNLSVLIDFKLGKDYIMTGPNRDFWRHGKHKATLVGRDVGYVIGDGVNEDGEVNTTQAQVQPFYEAYTGNGINEPFTNKAGFWKLRQISLSYDFYKVLPQIPYIKGLRLSIVSNNVAIFKKWIENVDPEQLYDFDDNQVQGSVTAMPPTRTIGFNLNVKF